MSDDVFAPPPPAAEGGQSPGPLGLYECRCADCAREPGSGECPNFRVRDVASAREVRGEPPRWLYALDQVHYCRLFLPAGKASE